MDTSHACGPLYKSIRGRSIRAANHPQSAQGDQLSTLPMFGDGPKGLKTVINIWYDGTGESYTRGPRIDRRDHFRRSMPLHCGGLLDSGGGSGVSVSPAAWSRQR